MLSTDLKFLENAYDALNKEHFNSELIRPVITIQKTAGAYGHFTPYNAWKCGDKEYREINIGAQDLDRDLVKVLATLQHEMVHQWCADNNIKDTSANGRYHNQKFKLEAEKRGLIITKGSSSIGWSVTTPSEAFTAFVHSKFKQRINSSRKREANIAAAGKAKSSTRKYICPGCSTSVRATKIVEIKCIPCDKKMESED